MAEHDMTIKIRVRGVADMRRELTKIEAAIDTLKVKLDLLEVEALEIEDE